MRSGRLGHGLLMLRAALICAFLVMATLPQMAGAHGSADAGTDAPGVGHLATGPHSAMLHMAGGACQSGPECSLQAVLAGAATGPGKGAEPSGAHRSIDTRMAGWPDAFDPPPPRPAF